MKTTAEGFPILSHKGDALAYMRRGLLMVARAALSSEYARDEATHEGLVYLLDVIDDLLPNDETAEPTRSAALGLARHMLLTKAAQIMEDQEGA